MRRFSSRVQQRKRQTWPGIPASGIEEVGHGQEQCGYSEGQARKGAGSTGSDRIGAEKRTLIVSKALADALQVLFGERHDFEEWQETASTFLINLAAAPAEETACFASMSRPEIVMKEKWSRQLEEFAATGVEE